MQIKANSICRVAKCFSFKFWKCILIYITSSSFITVQVVSLQVQCHIAFGVWDQPSWCYSLENLALQAATQSLKNCILNNTNNAYLISLKLLQADLEPLITSEATFSQNPRDEGVRLEKSDTILSWNASPNKNILGTDNVILWKFHVLTGSKCWWLGR